MTLDECITEYEQMVLASKGLRQTEAYNYGSQMLDWLKELRAWRQAFSKAKYTEITNEEALKILKEYHNMD